MTKFVIPIISLFSTANALNVAVYAYFRHLISSVRTSPEQVTNRRYRRNTNFLVVRPTANFLQIPVNLLSNCTKFKKDFENGGDFSIRTSLSDEKKLINKPEGVMYKPETEF